VSISTDGSVSGRPARRLRPMPAAGRIDTALRDSELLCREVLEALPAAVYTIDAEGRITFFNEAAADLWGCRPTLGTSEWCGSWRLYWPDGRPMRHDECPMAVAVKEGRPIHGAEAAAERPDGKRIPFLAYPRPLRDRSGALTGAVNTLIDITERKRSEEFEKRLASIVESSDDAIVSKDLDGIIRTWNAGAKRLFGYTAEEAIGKPILLLIPMDRHGEESDILSRIRRGECIDHYETVRQRKDGSLVEISVSVSPIKNAEGRVIGASKIARDITALARSRPNDLRSLRRPGAQQRPRVLHHHRALSADQRERRHEHCSCFARARDERGQIWGSIVSWRLHPHRLVREERRTSADLERAWRPMPRRAGGT
jgi:PAS domain S-box-containing protein